MWTIYVALGVAVLAIALGLALALCCCTFRRRRRAAEEHWLDIDIKLVIPILLILLLDSQLATEISKTYEGYPREAVLWFGVGWTVATLAGAFLIDAAFRQEGLSSGAAGSG